MNDGDMTVDGRATTQEILDFPWEVLEYLSWLRQHPASSDEPHSYLFDEPRVRFEVADRDVVVLDPDAKLELKQGKLRLESVRAPQGLDLLGIAPASRPALLDVMRHFDGARTLGEIRMLCERHAALVDALMNQAFGKFIFAPLALLSLERAVSGVEITRFPGSPYEIQRPYWQNMAAVRALLPELKLALGDDDEFLRQLRRLHVAALMGADLQTYYLPQSPISAGRAAPGRLMTTPSVLIEAADVCVFVSGPRVRAAFVGGAPYHAALYESLGDIGALSARHFSDAAGLDWGRIVRAKARGDAAADDWFCPPRPIRPGHISALRDALAASLRAAQAGERAACLSALAQFHRSFIRLHPFHCGNQSLAMNVVNWVLNGLLGAGVPHLMLDHLALRLSEAAYARIFERCAAVYADAAAPIAMRYLRLASTRTRTFELTRRMSAVSGPDAAREVIGADAGAARLLLLTD